MSNINRPEDGNYTPWFKGISEQIGQEMVFKCLKTHVNGHKAQVSDNDIESLENCVKNYFSSYSVVANAWTSNFNDSLFSGGGAQ